MSDDWIARLADDERKRDDVRLRAAAVAAKKSALARAHGRRVVDELRATVLRDVDMFRHEFPADPTRAIVVDDARPQGGFVVGKAQHPAVSLDITPRIPQS